MSYIPGVCDNCGRWFRQPWSNMLNATFVGVAIGPCPYCGGWGHVPDGTYNFIGNTIQVLRAHEHSVQELQTLLNLLYHAQAARPAPEELRKQIEEKVPELRKLADALPTTRSELYAFIALLISILTLMLHCGPEKAQSITVEQVINMVTTAPSSNSPEAARTHTQSPRAADYPKVGRNELCPCGSGKKYKHCHLRTVK